MPLSRPRIGVYDIFDSNRVRGWADTFHPTTGLTVPSSSYFSQQLVEMAVSPLPDRVIGNNASTPSLSISHGVPLQSGDLTGQRHPDLNLPSLSVAATTKRNTSGGEPVEMHSTQRLDPTIREIAARTQVKQDRFKSCPVCGEALENGFHLLDIRPTVVKYECQECEETDLIWAEKTELSRVSAKKIFEEAVNQ